jgi:cytochrome P450
MQTLVFCFATIQEIQRISAVASTSLPHGLTKDMTINGYHFPEGTSKNQTTRAMNFISEIYLQVFFSYF